MVRATVKVMVWPALKPAPLATGITIVPTLVAVPTVVAPAVPTAAMTAVSRLAPVSIIIVWPVPKSATLATLILFAPAAETASPVLTPSAFDGWPVPPLRRIRPVGLELTGFVETIVLDPGPSTFLPVRLILNRLMALDNRFPFASGEREPAWIYHPGGQTGNLQPVPRRDKRDKYESKHAINPWLVATRV